MSKYVRWLGELGLGDVETVGGKCANLGELMQAGFRVPAGFALTTAAYERFARVGEMPDDVLAELQAAYAQLGGDQSGVAWAGAEPGVAFAVPERRVAFGGAEPGVAVAIRSSAVGEDGAEASFAGQQQTYLWQRGARTVAQQVVRCWASLHSPEATAYRARFGAGARQPTMAVAVQRMVDARVAGVLFTLSPATGDRSMIAINASWGLGLGVVGGEVTPDEYWVDKVELAIRRRTIVAKPLEYRADVVEGGTRAVEVPAELRTRACLTDDEVLALARLGKRVEQHYGRPQDVEWAIARDASRDAPSDAAAPGQARHATRDASRDARSDAAAPGQARDARRGTSRDASGDAPHDAQNVFLLQSRPETVWSRRPATPLAEPATSVVDYVLRTLLR
jgi:pyruvate, water dikinase